MNYNLFVNGQLNGNVQTHNIESYMAGGEYSNASYTINHEEKEVYIRIDILQSMRKAIKEARK